MRSTRRPLGIAAARDCVHEGMTGMMENVFINVKNRSHSITAQVEIPEASREAPAPGVSGVILCQAGRFGGWSLYTKDGKVKYCYNWVGRERYTIESKDPLPAGRATVKFEFKYDGGGLGKGGAGALYVNDQKVGEGRIDKTHAYIFSADDTEDVGEDLGTPVTEDYKEGDNKFTGTIDKITLAVTPPPAEVEKDEERQEAVIDEGIN